MSFFISYLWEAPLFFAVWTALVFFSISVHEYTHARMALALGDDTAARMGHLTLNPFKQMGMFSIAMFLLIGICYGAVPVKQERLRGKYGDLIVSLSGPATNLVLAVVFYVLALVLIRAGIKEATSFALLGMFLNLALFALNILPVPPLDGFAIIRTFVPRRTFDPEWMRGLMMGIFVLLFMSFGKVSKWIWELCHWLIRVGSKVAGIDGGA